MYSKEDKQKLVNETLQELVEAYHKLWPSDPQKMFGNNIIDLDLRNKFFEAIDSSELQIILRENQQHQIERIVAQNENDPNVALFLESS